MFSSISSFRGTLPANREVQVTVGKHFALGYLVQVLVINPINANEWEPLFKQVFGDNRDQATYSAQAVQHLLFALGVNVHPIISYAD